MRSRSKHDWQQVLILALAVTGVLILVFALYSLFKVTNEAKQQLNNQAQLISQTKQALKKPTKANRQAQYDPNSIHDFNYQDYEAAIANQVINQSAVGIITIPAVGIEEPILEGVSNQNLSVGVVTVKPNEQPGVGNYALAGHNELNSGRLLFGNLVHVKVGDLIKITTRQREYHYQVTQVNHNLDASHGEIISDQQGSQIITLYTCNNRTEAGRIMVRGKLI
ncbi:class A sortase [Latilactobacillus fragifolii]|uniref:class A sortase n=1 Tax=Latilactobacillus fragifolii TaxID=2814244 RepID=UPI001ABAEDA3|nr:class A sortase [Latilactobacillus fragifolii]